MDPLLSSARFSSSLFLVSRPSGAARRPRRTRTLGRRSSRHFAGLRRHGPATGATAANNWRPPQAWTSSPIRCPSTVIRLYAFGSSRSRVEVAVAACTTSGPDGISSIGALISAASGTSSATVGGASGNRGSWRRQSDRCRWPDSTSRTRCRAKAASARPAPRVKAWAGKGRLGGTSGSSSGWCTTTTPAELRRAHRRPPWPADRRRRGRTQAGRARLAPVQPRRGLRLPASVRRTAQAAAARAEGGRTTREASGRERAIWGAAARRARARTRTASRARLRAAGADWQRTRPRNGAGATPERCTVGRQAASSAAGGSPTSWLDRMELPGASLVSWRGLPSRLARR